VSKASPSLGYVCAICPAVDGWPQATLRHRLFTRLGTWTRLRTCLSTLCHEPPEAEEAGTWILAIAPPLYYYCCLHSISLYGTKLAPSSACVTITYTSVTPCAVLQRLTIQSCRQTASRLKIPLSSTGYCWSCLPRSHLSCTSALLTITCTVDSDTAIYHQVTQSFTYDHRALRISFVVRSAISARITSTPIRASSML